MRRLWKQEGLSLPRRRPRRRRLPIAMARPHPATRPHEVWAYDFVHDRCNRGHRLCFLTITDQFTRQNLAVLTATSIKAADVLKTLQQLFAKHGTPRFLRSDNGPEFIAQAVQQWLQEQGVQTVYIEPGRPWQNGYAESFHSRLRDECLNREWFHNVREAKVVVEAWRLYYNRERPHSSLGYLTPLEFQALWERQQQQQWHQDQATATAGVF